MGDADEVERLRAALARATDVVTKALVQPLGVPTDMVETVRLDPDGARAVAEWRAMRDVCEAARALATDTPADRPLLSVRWRRLYAALDRAYGKETK